MLLFFLLVLNHLAFTTLNLYRLKAEYLVSQNRILRAAEVVKWDYKYQFIAGLLALSARQYEVAIFYNRRVAVLFPWNFDAINNMAVAYGALGDGEKARLLFLAILDLYPSHSEAKKNMEMMGGKWTQ